MDPVLIHLLFAALFLFGGAAVTCVIYVVVVITGMKKESAGILILGWLAAMLNQVFMLILTVYNVVLAIQAALV